MPKRTAVTSHGEIEYETVECDSCGIEVRKEDAYRFVVGDMKSSWSKPRRSYKEYNFYDDKHVAGWACEHCAEDPAGFPTKGWFKTWLEWDDIFFALLMGLLSGILGLFIGAMIYNLIVMVLTALF